MKGFEFLTLGWHARILPDLASARTSDAQVNGIQYTE